MQLHFIKRSSFSEWFFFFFFNRQFLLILDVDELQSLRGLSSDNNKLRLFHSDPLDYHSIIDALRGCSGLFYSFEPPSEHPNYDVSFRFSCLSLDCSGVLSSRFKLCVETKSLMLIFINLLGAGIHGWLGGKSCTQRARSLCSDRHYGESSFHIISHRSDLEGPTSKRPSANACRWYGWKEMEWCQFLQEI